jgi:hypothetical protein
VADHVVNTYNYIDSAVAHNELVSHSVESMVACLLRWYVYSLCQSCCSANAGFQQPLNLYQEAMHTLGKGVAVKGHTEHSRARHAEDRGTFEEALMSRHCRSAGSRLRL